MTNTKEMFNSLIQIGMVVNDLEMTLQNLSQLLGMTPFRIVEYPPINEKNCELEYMGEIGNFKALFCFFQYANIEFEVIQPVEGESIWTDFLKKNGGAGLHHIKFLVDNHKDVEKHFEQFGIKKVQKGSSVGINKGKSWAYYDTSKELGFYTEIMNKFV